MDHTEPSRPDPDGGHAHGHGHGHAHHHHGAGHSHAPADFGMAFAIGALLNLAYVVGEAIAGILTHSLALLADAGHNLGDVLGLLVAWLASRLGRTAPSARFTYGLRGSSILAALSNAVVLLLVTGGIAAEAIGRLFAPAHPGGLAIVVVAGIGMLVNGVTALLFMRGRDSDLNVRAAFTHMAADALVALGVVLAGLAILWTGWAVIDPLASLAISAIIVASTWSLLRDSLAFALGAVPPGIDRAAVEATLNALPGVTAVHDLHIWGMSTTETALTAHLVRPMAGPDDALLAGIAETLRSRHGIGHATLQIEQGDAMHPCGLADSGTV